MKKITINDLKEMKNQDEKISMITAYDYYMGKLVEEAGIDTILIGDSLGMVIQGRDNTLPVTLDEMIYHTQAVCRGADKPLIITDLPFMTFQKSPEQALDSAGRVMKESAAKGVKIEGGQRVVPQVESLTAAGIPVMGHLGLTPQSINQFGGFKVQGKDTEKASQLLDDALALQEAGVFAIVLETVPAELAAIVTEKLDIPTIGIGAGVECDGQVLVIQDLLGVDKDFKPRFARQYTDLNQIINRALKKYIDDVKQGDFPSSEESFHMDDKELDRFKRELNG